MGWLFFKKPHIAIRSARTSDSHDIAALHREGGFSRSWSAEEIESLIADRAVITDIACDSRKTDILFGFVMSRCADDEAEILTLVMGRKSRGKGFGHRLLEAHMSKLAGLGIKTLYLEVEQDNKPARALYEKMAFVTAGIRKGYYRKSDGSAANALIMKLGLESL